MGEPRPGVNLSWLEAVRVVPDLAAAEAQKIADEIVECKTDMEGDRQTILDAHNSRRDALIELGEAILHLDAQDLERVRNCIVRAQRVLGGKK
jgi:hypothetical protein